MIQKHLLTEEEKLNWWGEGEWVKEPDLIEFEHQGIQCKIKRMYVQEPYSKEVCVFGGHLCGYVAIPIDHPYYQKPYDDMNIGVHGGLTFGECSDKHWIGFDCAHLGDYTPSLEQMRKYFEKIELFTIRKKLENFTLLNPSYKNINFCIEECKSMAEQLNSKFKKDELCALNAK